MSSENAKPAKTTSRTLNSRMIGIAVGLALILVGSVLLTPEETDRIAWYCIGGGFIVVFVGLLRHYFGLRASTVIMLAGVASMIYGVWRLYPNFRVVPYTLIILGIVVLLRAVAGLERRKRLAQG